MQRPIKFRVWDKHNKSYIGEDNTATYYLPKVKIDGTVLTLETVDIDYDIEQFTGLLDKNGVEVYEGDIVRVFWTSESISVHEVYYEEAHFLLKDKGLSPWYLGGKKLEVIGNIYQNPELLKE